MKLNIKKVVKKYHKFHIIHNKISNKESFDNNNENQSKICDDNQDIEKSQIVVNSEFDNKIKDLQKEIDKIKNDIKHMKQLGTQLKSDVSSTLLYEMNKNINELVLDISNRLHNVGTQLISLSNATRSKPRDKNTNICISLQKKLFNDLKQTLNEFNKVKEENKYETYDIFKHQYKIRNSNATDTEIQRNFEKYDGLPVFVQELDVIQQTKRANQESQSKNIEIKSIEQSVEELLNTFKDTQTVLLTQNDVLVSIEENIDDTEAEVTQGSSEMVKAVKIRKSSIKKLWIITIIVTILLILLGIFLYILII